MLLNHDDDTCISLSDNDTTGTSDEPTSMSPGIAGSWADSMQNASPGEGEAKISDNNSSKIDLVIDENIITKYFIAAVQSHNQDPRFRVEPKDPMNGDTIPDHATSNNSITDINELVKSWEPKEIELPIWAVFASQKTPS